MDVTPFTYSRAIAPMLWVLVGLSCIELLVVHLLVAHWSRPVAAMLSIVTAGGVLWLVLAIRSFARRPVEVGGDFVLMRVGMIRQLRLPVAAIARVRHEVMAGEDKARDVLNLALIAYPNVIIDLAAPIVLGRRSIRAVAHRLDDPAAFARAIDALVAR